MLTVCDSFFLQSNFLLFQLLFWNSAGSSVEINFSTKFVSRSISPFISFHHNCWFCMQEAEDEMLKLCASGDLSELDNDRLRVLAADLQVRINCCDVEGHTPLILL